MKKLKQLKVLRVSSYESSIGCFIFIQFDTVNENLYYLIFFGCKYYQKTLPKNQLFCTKKPQISDKLLTMLLLLMLPISEEAARRCSRKQMFLKILQKHKKYLCRSICFNNIAVLQTDAPAQIFSGKFCKIFKNTSELLLLCLKK